MSHDLIRSHAGDQKFHHLCTWKGRRIKISHLILIVFQVMNTLGQATDSKRIGGPDFDTGYGPTCLMYKACFVLGPSRYPGLRCDEMETWRRFGFMFNASRNRSSQKAGFLGGPGPLRNRELYISEDLRDAERGVIHRMLLRKTCLLNLPDEKKRVV